MYVFSLESSWTLLIYCNCLVYCKVSISWLLRKICEELHWGEKLPGIFFFLKKMEKVWLWHCCHSVLCIFSWLNLELLTIFFKQCRIKNSNMLQLQFRLQNPILKTPCQYSTPRHHYVLIKRFFSVETFQNLKVPWTTVSMVLPDYFTHFQPSS